MIRAASGRWSFTNVLGCIRRASSLSLIIGATSIIADAQSNFAYWFVPSGSWHAPTSWHPVDCSGDCGGEVPGNDGTWVVTLTRDWDNLDIFVNSDVVIQQLLNSGGTSVPQEIVFAGNGGIEVLEGKILNYFPNVTLKDYFDLIAYEDFERSSFPNLTIRGNASLNIGALEVWEDFTFTTLSQKGHIRDLKANNVSIGPGSVLSVGKNYITATGSLTIEDGGAFAVSGTDEFTNTPNSAHLFYVTMNNGLIQSELGEVSVNSLIGSGSLIAAKNVSLYGDPGISYDFGDGALEVETGSAQGDYFIMTYSGQVHLPGQTTHTGNGAVMGWGWQGKQGHYHLAAGKRFDNIGGSIWVRDTLTTQGLITARNGQGGSAYFSALDNSADGTRSQINAAGVIDALVYVGGGVINAIGPLQLGVGDYYDGFRIEPNGELHAGSHNVELLDYDGASVAGKLTLDGGTVRSNFSDAQGGTAAILLEETGSISGSGTLGPVGGSGALIAANGELKVESPEMSAGTIVVAANSTLNVAPVDVSDDVVVYAKHLVVEENAVFKASNDDLKTLNMQPEGTISTEGFIDFLIQGRAVVMTTLGNTRVGKLVVGEATIHVDEGHTLISDSGFLLDESVIVLSGGSLGTKGGEFNAHDWNLQNTVVTGYGTINAEQYYGITSDGAIFIAMDGQLVIDADLWGSGIFIGDVDLRGELTEEGEGFFTVNKELLMSADSRVFGGKEAEFEEGLNLSNSATLTSSQPVNFPAGSTLSGSGSLVCDVNNAGRIAPGESPGLITIDGDLTLETTATLDIEIGASGFDQIFVSGQAVLAGQLTVTILDGEAPNIQPGDQFEILRAGSLSQQFDNVNIGSRISASGGLGSFLLTSNGASLFLSDFQPLGVNTFAAWAQYHSLSGNQALPLSIPFNDGVPNLLKYASNLNPDQPGSPLVAEVGLYGLPLITFLNDPRRVRVEYLRRQTDSTLHYEIQWCTSELLNGSFHWETLDGTPVIADLGGGWERVLLVAQDPSSAPGRFVRVRVQLTDSE